MNNKSVILTTIGFMCIGFTVWMLNLHDAAWIGGPSAQGEYMAFTLSSMLLGVIAILAFLHGNRVLDTVIFFGFAGLAWTQVHVHHAGPSMSDAGAGWYWFLWAFFWFYLWLASFKAGWARMLFLLGGLIASLAFALANWFDAHALVIVGAYAALIAALLAIYISAAEMINYGNGKTVLPTGATDS